MKTSKRLKCLGFWSLVFAAALLLGLPATARQEEALPRLTLMVYMCGSNLESEYASATADLQEMLDANFDAGQIKVLVMCGGSKSWAWDYDPEAANVQEIGRPPAAQANGFRAVPWDGEARNMGEAGTLSWFVENGVAHYPARDYALILWDHGGGPMEGVCWDERYSPDRLSIDEMTQALAAAKLPKKLSWIGFDACLMSTVEVAAKLAPYAEYMIASQAEEPVTGWNYAFLNGLEGDADGGETGARVVDSFFQAPRATACDLTMACVRLSEIARVEDAMSAMYQGMADRLGTDTFSSLARLRLSATGFGKAVEDAAASGYDLVDLVSLSECYAPQDEEGAQAIAEAVSRAVVCTRSNVEDCNGLSVYHPFRNQTKFSEAWRENYDRLDFCPGYSAYVAAYGAIMSGDHLVYWNDLEDIQVSDEANMGGGTTVALTLTEAQAANMASARLVVLARNLFDEADDAYFRVYNSADVTVEGTLLTAGYAGQSMQIVSESGMDPLTGMVSYRVSEDGLYLLELYPVEADGTRWQKPIIAAYEMDDAGVLVLKSYSVFDELTGQYSSRMDGDLSRFSGIVFFNDYRNLTGNESGEILSFDRWDEDTHTDVRFRARNVIAETSFAPSFALDPSRGEDLYAAYEITDTQGNTYMSRLVSLNPGGVGYYASEMQLDSAVPYVTADMLASWNDRQILLALAVTNLSDEPQFYMIPELGVNGSPAALSEQGSGSARLAPGETGYVVAMLDETSLEGMGLGPGDALEAVSGVLYMKAEREDAAAYWLEFTARPELSLDILFHDEAQPGREDEILEDVPLEILGGDQHNLLFSSRIVSQAARNESSARILVNTVLENQGDEDVTFYIRDVALNGVPVDAKAINAMGTGSQTANGRFSLALGERAAATVVLDYDTIQAILPDVSLRQVTFTMAVGKMEDDGRNWRNAFPVTVTTEVPLDLFYDDAAALPTREVLEYGAQNGALDAQSARTLLETDACRVSLQGLFIVERHFALLLNLENLSDTTQKIALGDATLDGEKAVIGQTVSAFVVGRNARVRAKGLDKALWQADSGVCVELAPGESRLRYVTVDPGNDRQTEASTIAFRACVYPTENPMDMLLFDGVTISTEEPGPLREGIQAVAPAEDYTITPGMPVTRPEALPLFREEVLVPEDIGPDSALTIEYPLPEGERLEKGYYILFRRIRSDKQLAEMNVFNNFDSGSEGDVRVRFEDGGQWLMYFASGPLSPTADGAPATGQHPGVVPAILSGGEALPLIDTSLESDEDGRVLLKKYGNRITLASAVFPNVALPSVVDHVVIAWDPAARQATLADWSEGGNAYDGALRNLIAENVLLLPGDADAEAVIALAQENRGVKRLMALLLDDPTMQLGLTALGDPEDYCVSFYYKTTDGEIRCTPPGPLEEYLGQ